MMIERWHTGHSLGTGVLGGLLLSRHGWTLVSGGFAVGLVLGLFASSVRRFLTGAVAWAGGRLLRPAADSALREWEDRRQPW